MTKTSRINLSVYIHRLHKKVKGENDLSLQNSTVGSVAGFVNLVAELLASKILSLQRRLDTQTLTKDTIRTAVELIMPPTLSVHCIAQGVLAVDAYVGKKSNSLADETKTKSKSKSKSKNKIDETKKDDSAVKSTSEITNANTSANTSDSASTSASTSDPKSDTVRISRTVRAKLIFPVSRFENYLKYFVRRVSGTSGIFFAAVLQYLAAELLEGGALVTVSENRKQITVDDLRRGVYGDFTSVPGLKFKKSLHKHVNFEGNSAHIKSVHRVKIPKPSNTDATTDAPQPHKTRMVASYVAKGDHDMQELAQKVQWSVVRKSWAGYLSQGTKHNTKLEVPTETATPIDAATAPTTATTTAAIKVSTDTPMVV
jgi:hypothetical protein